MADDSFEQDPKKLSELPLEVPDDFSMSPFERAALRQRRAVLRGRDAPDANTDPSELASIGASLIPGSGFVDILGYMPDFKGGYQPSLFENLRQGDYLSGGVQLASLLPGVGALRKVARATAGARRLAQRERIFDETVRRADGEVPQFDLPRRFPGNVPADLAKMLATQGLVDQMLHFIEEGKKKGADFWFNAEPLRQEFLKELGPQEGDRFFRKFIHYVAATSAGSDVGSNIRNASRYYGFDVRGEELPQVGEKLPSPYHHYNSRNHQIFVRRNFEDEDDQLKYPKLSSMFQNLDGNYDPTTIDRHLLRLPAMVTRDENFLKPKYQKILNQEQGLSSKEQELLNKEFTLRELAKRPGAWRNPTEEEIPGLEQFYKGLSQIAKLRPAQAAGAAWVGGADQTGVFDNGLTTFMQHFEDRLHLTADKWGIPAAEVLRRFIRGQMNLVALDDQQNATA